MSRQATLAYSKKSAAGSAVYDAYCTGEPGISVAVATVASRGPGH